jgi:hypothetical protein
VKERAGAAFVPIHWSALGLQGRSAAGTAERAGAGDLAARFRIPLGTVRDWEQGRREPDAAALAYLRVTEREPEAVERALAAPTSAA